MEEQSDIQLLRDYAEHGGEAAFREIVTRHAGVVYASALRQAGAPDLAQDIAQSVFTDLARKARPLAGTLKGDAALLGWLYRSTRFAALNQLRDDRRRLARERSAMLHLDSAAEIAPPWERLQTVLDAAMDDLRNEDREALLLRFFKDRDFRAIGAALGISDDAAQKRVNRALERLRARLASRGVTSTAGALAVLLAADALSLAPAGLAATLSTAALAGTTFATTSTATAAIAMTTLQKALISAALVVAAGTGIYEAHLAARLRKQNQELIAGQEQLAHERDSALSETAGKDAQLHRLRKDQNELLRLRGQVALLRQTEQENARLQAEKDTLAKRLQQAPIQSSAPQPGVRLSGISFKGNTRFSEAELAGLLISRVGEALDQQKLDTDVTEIWKKYREAGYSGVPVRAVEETDQQAGQTTVTFVIGDTNTQ